MSEVHESGGHEGHILSPELQIMWRMENKGDSKDKSKEEKQAQRKKMREQLEGLSDADKTALRDRLQAKWDTLPANEKQKITDRVSKLAEGKGTKARKGGGGKDRAKQKGRKAAASQ